MGAGLMDCKAIFPVLLILLALIFAGCALPQFGGANTGAVANAGNANNPKENNANSGVNGTAGKTDENAGNASENKNATDANAGVGLNENASKTDENAGNASENKNATDANAGVGVNENASKSGENETAGVNGTENANENPVVGEAGNASSGEYVPKEPDVFGFAYSDPNGGRSISNVCSITVNPSSALYGSQIAVDIDAYSPGTEEVTFLCGSEIKSQGWGAHFQDRIICPFASTGLIKVWLAIDGRICATAPLRIYNPASMDDKVCAVLADTKKDVSDGFSRNLSAGVYLANQKPDSLIKWACGEKNFSQRLGDLFFGPSVNGTVIVGCNLSYDAWEANSIPVSIDSTPCGDLLSG